MIPFLDGTAFRQYERRVRVFVSNPRVVPEKRARKLLERLGERVSDSFEGIHALETPNGVEVLLDHLRAHIEPIEVFRRGKVVDGYWY